MWCRWGRTITAVAFSVTASLASYEFASVAQIRNSTQSPTRSSTPSESTSAQIQSYTPSEVRAALRGLGYSLPQQGATLTDQATRNAIRTFQRGYKLSAVDGVAGPNTQRVMANLVRNLHRNLNLVLKLSKPLPISQYYTSETATAVEQFQRQINFPGTGVATVAIRSRLDQEAKKILGGSTSPGQTTPSPTPTSSPTTSPSPTPTSSPTTTPSPIPTGSPTTTPSPTPTSSPTTSPSPIPTGSPTTTPSPAPTGSPTTTPSPAPTGSPTTSPSPAPTGSP